MEDLWHVDEFNFNTIEDKLSSSNDIFWSTEELKEIKKVEISEAENQVESEGIESIYSNFGFFQDYPLEEEFLFSTNKQKYHQQPTYQDYEPLDNLHFDMVTSPLQKGINIMQFDEQFQPFESKKDRLFPTPLASVEILKNYGKGFKRLLHDEGKILHPVVDLDKVIHEDRKKLSTEDIMKIAGTKFIQSFSESNGLLDHPYGLNFSGLTDEEKEDVELAESLLACAEKVGNQQYERATKLLSQIESLSSKTGNPVKRVVHYFAEALNQRISKETGRVSSKDFHNMKTSFDPNKEVKNLNPTLISFYEELPFCRVSQFTLVEAVIENVINANKIHIIDLEIRKGVQWIILMQTLHSRNESPLQLLKITAIVSGNASVADDTGKRLKDFAENLNIPFFFNIVIVSDMLHLKESDIEIESDETVAVYSHFALRTKIQEPDKLENMMKVIRTINPIVMVVGEIEANHNSKSFVNRFIEALFYFSAFFDCFEDCMKGDEENRLVIESLYFSPSISNIVATEGVDRKTRNVNIDVWRAFFSRFGMVEIELSMMSLYQADLVAKRYPCGSSCTFDMNGHCLLIGWKGTPINSVSVWKFI